MNILLVEDDTGIATFIKKGLTEESYVVEHSSDGEEGLYMVQSREYDLIILDIMLPEMDGMALCRQIRKAKISTPIIMLTAKITVRDKVAGLEAGADDYITKPFSFEELLARVRAVLRRRDTKVLDLCHGILRIDSLARRAFCGKQEILLRPKEFGVLQYLLSNRGRVLSRTQILENVWGYDYDPNTNVIDVYIKYLREKLNPFLEKDIIRTVKGTGYMIEDSGND
jgi:DNA-binding response OmpR family regulator